MNLTPEDAAEYQRRCDENNRDKQAAILRGDTLAAKKARQANTALYFEFKKRELPEDARPLSAWDRELALGLEARVERIEEHLGIGRFSEEFS